MEKGRRHNHWKTVCVASMGREGSVWIGVIGIVVWLHEWHDFKNGLSIGSYTGKWILSKQIHITDELSFLSDTMKHEMKHLQPSTPILWNALPYTTPIAFPSFQLSISIPRWEKAVKNEMECVGYISYAVKWTSEIVPFSIKAFSSCFRCFHQNCPRHSI